METLERRVSHIEGKLDSLATKEDVANLRADMMTQMANQRAETKEMETRIIKWMVGAVLTGMAIASSLTVALQNLL